MSASLPTESAVDKAVNEFGIGNYDTDNGNGSRGEDDEDGKSESTPNGDALPGTHGTDPFGPDRLIGYPQTFSSDMLIITGDGRHVTLESYAKELADRIRHSLSVDMLPGDEDVDDTTHRHPNMDTIDQVLPTVAISELPDDHDNPSARSDYYDHMTTGMKGALSDIWADEDTGAYAGEKEPGTELPGVVKNETSMDDFLGALGNAWSGYETEDLSGPQGFPTEDFAENIDYDRSDNQDGGRIMTSNLNGRRATNLELVGDLTTKFIKEFGKKDLTRRHVISFLQKSGHHYYLASDIIRCLKLRHSVFIKDVMDEFPLAKTASMNIYAEGKDECEDCGGHLDSQGYCTDHNCPSNKYTFTPTPTAQNTPIANVRRRIIALECEYTTKPEVSSVLRRCAAILTHVIVDMEKLEKLV